MFHKLELEKIRNYLGYLLSGINENGLTRDEEREVLSLCGKCHNIIEKIDIENGIITLTPFMYKPIHRDTEPYLVYSVNCSNPDKYSGFLQGWWKCIHCGEGSQFRFYDDSFAPKYYTKCPKCGENFIVIDDSI